MELRKKDRLDLFIFDLESVFVQDCPLELRGLSMESNAIWQSCDGPGLQL